MHFDAVYSLVVIAFLCLVRWSAAAASSESAIPAAADTALDTFASLRTEFQKLTESSAIASISVAVSRNEQIIWEEAFGWANREKNIKAAPQTIYSLASLTKPPTATAIMILAERNLLDIDKPANDYLDDARIRDDRGLADKVTLRHLLNHTSGLPTYCRFFYENDSEPAPDIHKAIRDYAFLANGPGEAWDYCNLGYGILEHIIANVSGMTYEAFMEKEIFQPLGMAHSAIGAPNFPERIAQRYDDKQKPIINYDFEHRGGSAMYASAHDMLRFGMFHLKTRLPDQRRILTDVSLDAMQNKDPAHPSVGPIGLGWKITHEHGMRTLSHTGQMPGVSTMIKLVPAENIAVVVLANTSDARIYNLPDKILAAMPEAFQKSSVAEVSLPVPCPTAWEGHIHTSTGDIALDVIVYSGVRIEVSLNHQDRKPMHHITARANELLGYCDLMLDHPDIHNRPHVLYLKLFYDGGDAWDGYAYAQSPAFALPYRVTLKKTPLDKSLFAEPARR